MAGVPVDDVGSVEISSLEDGECVGDISWLARLALSCIPNNFTAFLSFTRKCGIVSDRVIVGLFIVLVVSCSLISLILFSVRRSDAEGERTRDARLFSVGSPPLCPRTAAKSFRTTGLEESLIIGGGGAFRLLLGPTLLPRPGRDPASKLPSEKELKTLALSRACAVSESWRASTIVVRDLP